jgi:isopenicillin N synthase-like dioxygenase|tara:strand:+ start:29328 stop:30188 length:861 start_codon:yes stop_codon:yes gene_type:complete
MSFEKIPTIRLSDGVFENAEALRRARYGFVYLDPYPSALLRETMREAFARAEEFFARDIDEKMKCATKSGRGYTREGAETLDVESSTSGDAKEGFYVGPDGAPWPDDFDEFRAAVEDYYGYAHEIARALLRTFAFALGHEYDYFDEDFGVSHACVLRLLRYAPTPSKVDEGKFACGAHTDYGLFTLLATDSVPGLQVFDSETNEWIPVRPPREDMFVLNVGDLMQFWSDGAFKSTKHRVVMDGDRERYSMAFFVEPNHACVITPSSPTRATTFGEYLAAKYRETYA